MHLVELAFDVAAQLKKDNATFDHGVDQDDVLRTIHDAIVDAGKYNHIPRAVANRKDLIVTIPVDVGGREMLLPYYATDASAEHAVCHFFVRHRIPFTDQVVMHKLPDLIARLSEASASALEVLILFPSPNPFPNGPSKFRNLIVEVPRYALRDIDDVAHYLSTGLKRLYSQNVSWILPPIVDTCVRHVHRVMYSHGRVRCAKRHLSTPQCAEWHRRAARKPCHGVGQKGDENVRGSASRLKQFASETIVLRRGRSCFRLTNQ